MSTKADNITNPASCWNRAANEEPVFVLRATDPNAHKLVTQWAVMYAQNKGGWHNMTEAQRAKFYDALACASEMRERWMALVDDIPF